MALLPGQYSDNCKRYTSQELNKLPLNTAMELHVPKVGQIICDIQVQACMYVKLQLNLGAKNASACTEMENVL